MMTVNEVSQLTGVSIRTLQYYDQIGLLHPAGRTKAGYRLYDDAALERLQQILLFRELEFPLREIQRILESPSFDWVKALDQQITLLTLKKQHLDDLFHWKSRLVVRMFSGRRGACFLGGNARDKTGCFFFYIDVVE